MLHLGLLILRVGVGLVLAAHDPVVVERGSRMIEFLVFGWILVALVALWVGLQRHLGG